MRYLTATAGILKLFGSFWGETQSENDGFSFHTFMWILQNETIKIKTKQWKGWKWTVFLFVFQAVVSFYEAANNVIIELDMDNSLFGFPRELVVAGVGKNEKLIILFLYCCHFTRN